MLKKIIIEIASEIAIIIIKLHVQGTQFWNDCA